MPKILPGQTDIYALTDSRLSLGRPLEYIVTELLKAGIKIVQYREKRMPPEKMLEECRMLRKLTEAFGACFIVNDHVELAIQVNADGVHIGQDDMPVQTARQMTGPDMIIGISTHSPQQAAQAMLNGADYIGVGPIFATKTKEDVVPPVGFEYLDWVVENITIPYVVIGGIKAHNAESVAEHGAICCALVSEFVGASDIGAKVTEVREAMKKGWLARESREAS